MDMRMHTRTHSLFSVCVFSNGAQGREGFLGCGLTDGKESAGL